MKSPHDSASLTDALGSRPFAHSKAAGSRILSFAASYRRKSTAHPLTGCGVAFFAIASNIVMNTLAIITAIGMPSHCVAGEPSTTHVAATASILNAAFNANESLHAADAPAVDPEKELFFEQRVRPLLASHCLQCHGSERQQGGLRLDSHAGLTTGGDAGPVIDAANLDGSSLLEVIRYDSDIKMPPAGKLAQPEIDTLSEWVRQGAYFPASTAPVQTVAPTSPEGIAAAAATHWSLQPINSPPLPTVDNPDWSTNSIDRLVYAKLKSAGLKPSAAADRRTLLRRLSYDLTGLPPTPEEYDAFETETSPRAIERVIDRLLASPRYGERWARHWLDVARYADTKGYVTGTEERRYPYSFTYRDYVVNALNNDLPYDRFILEQLAADQLPDRGNDPAPLAALGFLTTGRRFTNNFHDIMDDRIDVTMRGMMGLTVTCARCHDHKYDPFPTEDYYSLYGVFASCHEPAELPIVGEPADSPEYQAFKAGIVERQNNVQKYVATERLVMIEDFRSKTDKYLVTIAASRLRNANQPVPDVGVDPVVLNPHIVRQWEAFLQNGGAAGARMFDLWRMLQSTPSDQFPAALTAALNDPATRPNPRFLAALNAAPPANLVQLAAAYGKLLTETHEQAKCNAAGVPTTSPVDDEQSLARAVLYDAASPTLVPEEATRRYFLRDRVEKLQSLEAAIEQFKGTAPGSPPRAMVVVDNDQPVTPVVFIRGNPGRHGASIPRRFLRVLSGGSATPFTQGSGRLELARRIVAADNPLTARVIANRVWLHHFGAGLVTTPSDFGIRGDRPVQKELLDYLARSLIDDGWSLKRLHKRILLSQTYQQSSTANPAAVEIDPENRLLWRNSPKRLDFEQFRDSLLFAAGKLDETRGGRSVDLFEPPYSTRRSLYAFIDRQNLPGVLRSFDFPSPDVSAPQRSQTSIPQQALFNMNAPFVMEQAVFVTRRPDVAGRRDDDTKVQAVYRAVLGRNPNKSELAAGIKFLATIGAAKPDTPLWQYGYGTWNPQQQRLSAFKRFPQFKDNMYCGGDKMPDAKLGWTQLHPAGGHPGGNTGFMTIRRWTSPGNGRLKITSTLKHTPESGNGVQGWIVLNKRKLLANAVAERSAQELTAADIKVTTGQTVDFIVDSRGDDNSDSFEWTAVLVLQQKNGVVESRSLEQFGPPPDAPPPGLEVLAHALLQTNEFSFID